MAISVSKVLSFFRIQALSMNKTKKAPVSLVATALKRHFGRRPLHNLITASRTFPVTARVDVQLALDKLFAEYLKAKLLGIHAQYQHETLTMAHLMGSHHFPVVIGPLQHEEIDIGEALPARCLRQGLWLAQDAAVPFAVLLSPAVRYGHTDGTNIEIAVPPGEAGSQLSRRLLDELESLVRKTASYRGKVISLETPDRYSGHQGPLRVHKLRSVQRDEVILPEKTLELLDRNVGEFVRQRERLRKLGLPIKKGVLFYGPPGTGKNAHHPLSRRPVAGSYYPAGDSRAGSFTGSLLPACAFPSARNDRDRGRRPDCPKQRNHVRALR